MSKGEKMLNDVLALRRSIYALGNQLPISDDDVIKIVSQCVLNAPSAFNAQSSRVVILLAEKHKKFWSLVAIALEKVTPPEKIASVLKRVEGFAAAYGTILFFEDEDILAKMQKQYALYADAMENWLQQGNAILSYMVWQCLAEKNIGASLQHYGNLVEKAVISEFNLPKSWRMVAQMPFGNIVAPAAEKIYLPLEDRMIVIK